MDADESVYGNCIDDAFFDAVAAVLAAHPAGLSEYELLSRLREAGYFSFLGDSPWEQHALFCAHFLLFHTLYRLRDRAWQGRQADVEISPLRIRWLPCRDAEAALAEPDQLRAYYLDLANLEQTTADDVERLIASFWVRMQRQDRRAEALAELGLSDPVDDITIRRAYRRLAMRHHPDRGGDKERLQAIHAAVEVLLKPVRSS